MPKYAWIGLLLLLFTGCSSSISETDRLQLGFQPITIPAMLRPPLTLQRDYKVIVVGGAGILGDSKMTLLSGEYVEQGESAEGVYYRNKDRGVVRSGNVGIVEAGGFFVPLVATERWRVWLVPYVNRDAMIGLVGAVGAALPTPESKSQVLVLSKTSTKETAELRQIVSGAFPGS